MIGGTLHRHLIEVAMLRASRHAQQERHHVQNTNRLLTAAATAAVASVLASAPAWASTVPPVFSNNQSGVLAQGDTYKTIQTVITLPHVDPPNGETFLGVYLSDPTGTVVLALGQVPAFTNTDQHWGVNLLEENPTPGLAPGYTLGYTDTGDAYTYAPGDKVMLSLSYGPDGTVTYTVVNLTNVTVPVYSGQFLDAGQQFTSAFAGALFSGDVYAAAGSFTQPSVKTELVHGTHTLITDINGVNVTNAVREKVAAGGSNLGKKFTAVTEGTGGVSYTVYLLP